MFLRLVCRAQLKFALENFLQVCYEENLSILPFGSNFWVSTLLCRVLYFWFLIRVHPLLLRGFSYSSREGLWLLLEGRPRCTAAYLLADLNQNQLLPEALNGGNLFRKRLIALGSPTQTGRPISAKTLNCFVDCLSTGKGGGLGTCLLGTPPLKGLRCCKSSRVSFAD